MVYCYNEIRLWPYLAVSTASSPCFASNALLGRIAIPQGVLLLVITRNEGFGRELPTSYYITYALHVIHYVLHVILSGPYWDPVYVYDGDDWRREPTGLVQ